MKAIEYTKYGSLDVLQVKKVTRLLPNKLRRYDKEKVLK